MNVLVLVDIGHFVQEWWDTCPQAGPKTVGLSASEPSLTSLTTVNGLLKLKGSIYIYNRSMWLLFMCPHATD